MTFINFVTFISIFGFLFPLMAQASPIAFSCKIVDNVPTTILTRNNGEQIKLIRWFNTVGDSSTSQKDYYTPQKRCDQVSNRAQRYFNGEGRFITYGVINNHNVICLTNKSGYGCNELFFTITTESEPKDVLEDLFRINNSKKTTSRASLSDLYRYQCLSFGGDPIC
jgi:hypothetical protein